MHFFVVMSCDLDSHIGYMYDRKTTTALNNIASNQIKSNLFFSSMK